METAIGLGLGPPSGGRPARMNAAPEEGSLVSAARGGDRTAFGRLHGLYARMVHAILLGRVPRSDAADLVQEVFLTALHKLATLRDSAAFGPWLARIARNRASDYHRRSRQHLELTDEPAEPSRSEGDLEAERILEAIRELPEAYRETLLLRLVEGMTGPEIAAATGRTAASVRVNLHRGMKQLRERLGLPDSGAAARASEGETE